MFFPSSASVRRIEAAEARSLAALVHAPDDAGFVHEFAGGFALYRSAGSPLNKVVGAGFAPVSEDALGEIERCYAARGAPVQVELSTHADPALTSLLARRGYHFAGYEDVHACAIADLSLAEPPADLTVRRARDDERDAWIDVLVTGFSQAVEGERTAEHDDFGREALEGVFRDMSTQTPPERWVALRAGQVVGGASVTHAEGISFLFGAATQPEARRRGVQRALLHARLRDGLARGTDLAVVTTQPGSASQQNVLRAGFALAYARAVWLRTE
ncbi:MAG: GNAT family N-acetyltransferase [Polyangiales bacterium]